MSGGALGRKVLRHSPQLFPLPPCLSIDGVLAFACRASSSTSSAAVQLNESKAPGDEQVLVLRASPRDQSGSRAAAVLRKTGRVPGILFSMPNDEKGKLVSFDEKEITSCVQKLGRTAWGCTVFAVHIEEDTEGGAEIRAVGRQVHMTASSGAVENVTLLHCPSDRRVKLQVPLKVFGFEICPGLKAGGRINWITRTIACTAMGSAIPNAFEVDIGHLEINDKLSYGDLTLPEGVVLSVKDMSLPILKIMRK